MKIKNLFNEKYDEMHHREIVIVRQDLNSLSCASRTDVPTYNAIGILAKTG